MGKKQKCPEFENHERWLVSYADMVTLLFAVFVVLYALSLSGTPAEKEQVAGSIQESFNMPFEDIPSSKRDGQSNAGWGIFENYKGDRLEPPEDLKYPGQQERFNVITKEMKKVQLEIEERLYGRERFRDPEKAGSERIISIHRNNQGFKLRLLTRAFFDSGGVELNNTAKNVLSDVADILKDINRRITIEGHTDNLPAGGRYTNWEISTLRAASVARYIIARKNFPTSLVSIAGYAELKPIADNGSESGRSLNRRIEIQVHYDNDVGLSGELQ
ncbi:MAG: flagellar motor protein MotB [Oligoflexales bacterium]|nr:flagellar motor protein MotB [Oligoflexales bacterium]